MGQQTQSGTDMSVSSFDRRSGSGALTSSTSTTGSDDSSAEGYAIAHSQLQTFMTPSGVAADLRPDLDPVQAADIYTGAHASLSFFPFFCLYFE